MSEKKTYLKMHWALLPVSILYEAGVRFRNMLFNMNILKSRSFDIPIISVGNITVGGTGKTPHVEYLIRLLHKEHKVAVLSRGYKRKTKGYLLADSDTTSHDIGDEPYQIHKKFCDIHVAVCADRCHGIERLTHDHQSDDTDVIVLDDAYQHRYVKPGINILLVDYHRPICNDRMLPVGRLREPQNGKNRADVVIITKCPESLSPMDYRVLSNTMNLFPYQRLFFSTIKYADLFHTFDNSKTLPLVKLSDKSVLLVTGLATPQYMKDELRKHTSAITSMQFPDHHNFSIKDLKAISNQFCQLPQPRLIVTSEKDWMRLESLSAEMDDTIRSSLFILPIEIEFCNNSKEEFDNYICGYVQKNSKRLTQMKVLDRKETNKNNIIKF